MEDDDKFKMALVYLGAMLIVGAMVVMYVKYG